MTMDSMDGMAVSPDVDVEGAALDQAQGSCAHCMGHSGIKGEAVLVTCASAQSSRELSASAPATSKMPTALASPFASRPHSRQHAPPRTSTSRHVLISVFLI
jgi:hypothetical protein